MNINELNVVAMRLAKVEERIDMCADTLQATINATTSMSHIETTALSLVRITLQSDRLNVAVLRDDINRIKCELADDPF